MPVYEYHCDDCGRFSEIMPLDRRNEGVPCPACGGAGRRLISAPNLAMVRRDVRIARERNERAAHEPGRIIRKNEQHTGRHQCGGHTHGGHEHNNHKHRHDGRPWMLGH